MLKYLLKRLLHGFLSIIVVVGIVMVLIFSLMNRSAIFYNDDVYKNIGGNSKEIYKNNQWEKFGYIDFVQYSEYLSDMVAKGKLTETEKQNAAKLGNSSALDSALTKKWIEEFKDYYGAKGYTITRLNARKTGNVISSENRSQLYASRDIPLIQRLWTYFTSLIVVDTVHYAKVDKPGLKLTLFDPAYGGKTFSPAIMGNGTKHKYLLYFNSSFPFVHQNLISFQLGKSYSIYAGNDIFLKMTESQGSIVTSLVTYPTGYQEITSFDLHSATFVAGELSELDKVKFTDNYTNLSPKKDGLSMMANSFVIGVIASILAYLLGVPLGILMARKKDKLADGVGTFYIVFIMAVPSLAYIYLFRQIGSSWFHLPTHFAQAASWKGLVYVLPIVSLALPSVAGIMKWLRRYMIDQMNSDYVKFARSGGLSEGEIFRKHILKNAAIPIVHGIPGTILGALTGAIITERVYAVPGAGKLLTDAINSYDNGIIVGLTFFYAILSVLSLILGDILMALVDPRISFTSKGR